MTDQKSLGHYVYFVEVSGTKDNQFILTDEHADQVSISTDVEIYLHNMYRLYRLARLIGWWNCYHK